MSKNETGTKFKFKYLAQVLEELHVAGGAEKEDSSPPRLND